MTIQSKIDHYLQLVSGEMTPYESSKWPNDVSVSCYIVKSTNFNKQPVRNQIQLPRNLMTPNLFKVVGVAISSKPVNQIISSLVSIDMISPGTSLYMYRKTSHIY